MNKTPSPQAANNQDSNNQDGYRFDAKGALIETNLHSLLGSDANQIFAGPIKRGKVRDVYDMGDRLLIVSSDRISAFDFILPCGIPDKGRILTATSEFWFANLDVQHHLLSCDVPEPLSDRINTAPLVGRVMVARKADVVPFECVVRGYLEGSGWAEYQESGIVGGNSLPAGLRQCDPLSEPIFTPATKADQGHDENVTIGRMIADLGSDLALRLRKQSLQIYHQAASLAATRGLIIADTKFEFGRVGDDIILIDEVLTPDSSRYWAADNYHPGQAQVSFDKQFVREWLSASDWDKNSPPPNLPDETIQRTRAKYVEAYERLSGKTF